MTTEEEKEGKDEKEGEEIVEKEIFRFCRPAARLP